LRRVTRTLHCTSKGKKVGNGGRTAHFFVAILYGKGVVMCEHYGEMFTKFVEKHFPIA